MNTPLKKPPNVAVDRWFADLADRLLCATRLVVAGRPHRLVEIEFYLFTGRHPDPFTYRHPLQRVPEHWFFHRSGNSYRNGSFKGLDVTITGGGGCGGILLRSLETPDGRLIVGPSLCVDYLLASCNVKTCAELDAAIGSQSCWTAGSPLSLRTSAAIERPTIFRTARIGLSLKKAERMPDGPRYITSPYRFLTEPRKVGKGRLHLVLALHMSGMAPPRIGQITGCPGRTIRRYIEDFEIGRSMADFAAFLGAELRPRELCQLHGRCSRVGIAHH